MHIPLVIAVLALLVLVVLLPVLDRAAGSEMDTKSLRSYLVRIARWTKE